MAATTDPDRHSGVASPAHTILVLALIVCWAVAFKFIADKLSLESHPPRVTFYLISMFLEWLILAIVLAGARSNGAIPLVLAEGWHSPRQVVRDLAIAAGFWILAMIVLRFSSELLRITSSPRQVTFIVPHGPAEMALWIILSISAGICEETIFRGYLQRQFIALTKSAPAGILLSAIVFGAAHAYQGLKLVTLIAIYGLMFGILAYWRRSIRPGIFAHAWQDSLSGILASLPRH
jgi:membrane protease YdiL (CAAX protease family)